MAQLTQAEQNLFAKYWGSPELEKSEEFWNDALKEFSRDGTRIHLPIQYNPQTARKVLEDLECPSGECGKCCRQGAVPIFLGDIKRICENTNYTAEYIKEAVIHKGDKAYIRQIDSGCPFLGLNVCTIYKYRPDACYLFPIVASEKIRAGGNMVGQMVVKIPCQQVMAVVRKIITGALESGDKMLLPNLVIINKEEHNGANSSRN